MISSLEEENNNFIANHMEGFHFVPDDTIWSGEIILFLFILIIRFGNSIHFWQHLQMWIGYWVLTVLFNIFIIFFFSKLQKEVTRLRSLVNGGTDNHDNDAPTVSFPGSPGTFKWEGLHGLSSPLISDKRMSQVYTIT